MIDKLTVRDFFDLKKMIGNISVTVRLLDLTPAFFQSQRIEVDNIIEGIFKKLILKTQESKST